MHPTPITLFLRSVPEPLSFLVHEVKCLYPSRFDESGLPTDVVLDSSLGAGAHRLTCGDREVTLSAGDRIGALRGLAHLMGASLEGRLQSYEEQAPFARTLGTMLDCCRNAVPKIATLKELLLKTALMGFNSAMLYMEDTYIVEEEPYFGYLRGGYTKAELKELDDYADALGMELFPAIQTLGHFEQFLQWPVTQKYQDTATILCPLVEETYALLERLLGTLSECFRSRRINLGMDEAFGLGEGAFKRRVGSMPPAEIMNRHLARVKELCAKFHYKPMIWSDMYFCCGSKSFSYYDPEWHLDDDIIANIPHDVQLCYWDYYHTTQKHYETFMRFHQKLGCDVIFAGTAWVSNGMWCAHDFVERTLSAAIPACRTSQVNDIFITLWGDDGAEGEFLTALPALQHAAELVYAAPRKFSKRLRASHLLGSCNLHYADWRLADQVNTNAWFPNLEGKPSGAQKSFFWEDPALAIFDAECPHDEALNAFYATLSKRLLRASRKTPESAYLAFEAMIANALSLKLGLRNVLHERILAGDRNGVAVLVVKRMKPLQKAVRKVWDIRETYWMERNNSIGWEVLEARYASMVSRLETLSQRLLAWSYGELDSLPEFEVKLLPISGENNPPLHLQKLPYSRMKTPSCIK